MGYDTLGRMTSLNTNRIFVYDSDGRMVKATAPDGTITYYPSENYEVTVKGGIETHTSYLIHQTRHASITTETGKEPSALYYQYDHLASVVAVFDTNGTVATEYSYDEFGATTVTRGEDISRYKFSGKEEFDGLYYFGARFYDPAVCFVWTFQRKNNLMLLRRVGSLFSTTSLRLSKISIHRPSINTPLPVTILSITLI